MEEQRRMARKACLVQMDVGQFGNNTKTCCFVQPLCRMIKVILFCVHLLFCWAVEPLNSTSSNRTLSFYKGCVVCRGKHAKSKKNLESNVKKATHTNFPESHQTNYFIGLAKRVVPRQRERERERERDRQTDRQTGRQTDRQTDRFFYFSKSSVNTITSMKVKLSRVISADSAAHLLQKVCPLLIYKWTDRQTSVGIHSLVQLIQLLSAVWTDVTYNGDDVRFATPKVDLNQTKTYGYRINVTAIWSLPVYYSPILAYYLVEFGKGKSSVSFAGEVSILLKRDKIYLVC